jgi:hypothetical protein
VFTLLLAAQRLCGGLPRWTVYLLPPGLLCVGALDWSLWSGMEVALFLALWGVAFVVWDDLHAAASSGKPLLTLAACLGLCGAAVVATRPEGVAAVFVLVASLLWTARGREPKARLLLAALSSAPALLVLVAQATANRLLTGESSAAGALVKLEMHHPFMTRAEVWDAWLFHLKYQVLRVTQYHFSDVPAFGWLVWLLATVPLFDKATRRYALVLWASAASWVMVVALNGQVRWQNERYTMPAVAWLLLDATLGLGALLSLATRARDRRAALAGPLAGIAMATLFLIHQAPRFRDQVWFFGRASRNILDQHLTAGEAIRSKAALRSNRVLVGDAGAIPYASDTPALDIIGLGGFRGLPFARATRINVAAAIELIERIPPSERPDLMALYPSWWGDFPSWFGDRIAEFPVRGNVICGGASKVLYRPRWESLDHSGVPSSLEPDEQLVDGVDMADLVSEGQHHYRVSVGNLGRVAMKLLPNPNKPSEDLWDAARIVSPGVSELFDLDRLTPGRPLWLVVRSAPTVTTDFDLYLDGERPVHVTLPARDGWSEVRVPLPASNTRRLTVRLGPSNVERALYQVWAVQRL